MTTYIYQQSVTQRFQNLHIECHFSQPLSTSIQLLKTCVDIASAININQGSIEVSFLTPDEMIELNTTHLSHNYLTDIISFNLGTLERPHADLYICPAQAAEQAKEFNQTTDDELRLLLVHGLLHVIGYTDTDPKSKAIMQQEEQRVLHAITA